MTIPKSWLVPCRMGAIVAHWTAGAHKASPEDRDHYHILIENDGALVRGEHPIDDNVNIADNNYAGHTRNFNSGVIGISVCCMSGAQERPFKPGKFPMTKTQWEAMAQVAAELCKFYSIPVTPRSVLQHGEVQKTLGIQQRGKWDCMVLPWEPRATDAGDRFRKLVSVNLQLLLTKAEGITSGVVRVAADDVLNMRAGPSVRDKIVAELPNGTKVKIISDPAANWINVEALGKSGWVAARFVDMS